MASKMIEKRINHILIQGFSLAGEETVIALPEMNLAFDVGRAPREIIGIDHICLSHGHMDHAAGIAYYFSQRNFQGAPPGTVLVQHQLVPAIEDLMQVWGRIEGHISPYNIVGVDQDEDFTLNRNLIIRPFRVCHPGPTLGFSAIEVRKKLKPEYSDLSGQQIVNLKKAGQTVEYRLEIPKVAFCGDSTIGDFLDHDHVRNAQILIIECTFFEDDHLERARKGQHLHITDWPQLMERINCPNVILHHVSRRTGIRQAKQILAEILSKVDRQRITFLMDIPRKPRRVSQKTENSPPIQGEDQVNPTTY
ncbi:MAG: MBL fold metallo-hydrolase [Planctomycetota bacterium]|jgi:ribonuclease Z